MAYNLSEHEMKIFLDNVDLTKFYKETQSFHKNSREPWSTQGYKRISDDTMCFMVKNYYVADEDLWKAEYTIFEEPTESELKEPTPRLVLTPQTWEEFQAIVDMIQTKQKESDTNGGQE